MSDEEALRYLRWLFRNEMEKAKSDRRAGRIALDDLTLWWCAHEVWGEIKAIRTGVKSKRRPGYQRKRAASIQPVG